MISEVIISLIQNKTSLAKKSITNTLKLLVEEDCTIPFITRYRKEMTDGLNEVQIADIQKEYEQILTFNKRKEYILKSLKENDKLTKDLEKSIHSINDLASLEDLYAPYKTKRKTKGMLAIEAGLQPLADLFKTTNLRISDLKSKEFPKFFNDKVKNEEDALAGMMSILIEEIAQDVDLKSTLRAIFQNSSTLWSEKTKKAEEIKDFHKYKDYFEFSQPLKTLRDPKASHRYLAIRRGMLQKVLKVNISIDDEIFENEMKKHFNWLSNSKLSPVVDSIRKLAMKRIHLSLELNMMSELKEVADESAINVFSKNLKDLLLQPYLGPKTVLGIDPGVRTGCKIALIDQTGKFLLDTVIYPHPPKNEVNKSMELVSKIIERFKVEFIAVGNGTFGRETLALLKKNIESIKSAKVKTVLVNEDGASIYSASEIARKEFPDKDPTVRGAISIARRLQDPLAELVKIDPKSIGVGQYQHDIHQAKLKKSLESVVEFCVNFVGVDLNTASSSLLSYISGVGPKVAENIVKKRESSGGFKSREELLKVSRFSEKIYEQAIGFMRIYEGKNPLDATFIHPERYKDIENWCDQQGIEVTLLIKSSEEINKLEKDQNLKNTLGDYTHKDIIQSLRSPRQDPREEFKTFEFKDDISGINDIKTGDFLPGLVTNITKFGAFVDIGIKENGLIHVSQMSNEFIDDPFKVLKIGQKVKAKVLEVDLERGRISLTLKSGEKIHSNQKKTKKSPLRNLENNAFSGLKNFKIKK